MGHETDAVKRKNAYRVQVENPKEGGPHGRPRLRWENIIKIDLKDLE